MIVHFLLFLTGTHFPNNHLQRYFSITKKVMYDAWVGNPIALK